MFHRNDCNDHQSQIRPDFNVEDQAVNEVLESIQKREMKKTQKLANAQMTDPSAIMIFNLIKTAGVKADAIKTLLCLLNNKQSFDNKLLKNLTTALKSNRAEILALLMNAYTKFIKDHIKRDDPHRVFMVVICFDDPVLECHFPLLVGINILVQIIF